MTFKSKNYWALIVGGSGGMGMATAKKLAAHGMNIAIIHRDRRSRIESIKKDFAAIEANDVKLLSYNVDALNPEVIQNTLAAFKQEVHDAEIRLYLHALAKGNLKPMAVPQKADQTAISEVSSLIQSFYSEKEKAFSNITAEMKAQDLTMTIQAMGINFYEWAKSILELDLFSSKARIIGLTSEGDKKVWEGYAAVASAKAVMDSLCKYMAISFASRGITTNLIQAGVTITESFNLIPGSQFIAASTKLRNPNKRLTQPTDVANAIYLLCKDEADWINGTTLTVDGGEHLV